MIRTRKMTRFRENNFRWGTGGASGGWERSLDPFCSVRVGCSGSSSVEGMCVAASLDTSTLLEGIVEAAADQVDLRVRQLREDRERQQVVGCRLHDREPIGCRKRKGR